MTLSLGAHPAGPQTDAGAHAETAFDTLPEAAVLSAPPAPVTLAWAAALLQRHWGLAGMLSALSGERDSNFLLTLPAAAAARGAHSATHGPPRQALLRVSHPIETPLVADFQTQALRHIAQVAPGLPVQRLWPTPQQALAVQVQGDDGQPRVVRLFSYLSGLPLPQAPRSAAQRANVALSLARLDRALTGLQHPAGQLALPWDIQRAEQVRPLLALVPDADRRALAQRALAGFEQFASPRLAGLRRQPIHNDFNLYNLLVRPEQPDEVAGILDFGDMVEAPLVNDLAVALAYQIGDQPDDTQAVLATLSDFVAAYHAELPLQAAELDLLWHLVQARLVMVVAISGWRAARQPHNAAYLLRNNVVSWARLQACAAVSPAQAREALHAACGR